MTFNACSQRQNCSTRYAWLWKTAELRWLSWESKAFFPGERSLRLSWTRYAVEELLGGPAGEGGVYMTPTYGNTLMGLACSKPVTAEEGYKISYYAPQPRAVAEVVSFEGPYIGCGLW